MADRFETVEQTCRLLQIMTAGLVLMTVSALPSMPKLLVWNASNSVPVGLYFVSKQIPQRGDLVFVNLPNAVRKIAHERGYLPTKVPAIKRIAALDGDRICRIGRRVSVNGIVRATAFLRDRNGLKLPVWTGCFTLGPGDVFLLADHPHSFDGRYFGHSETSAVPGAALPIWVRSN